MNIRKSPVSDEYGIHDVRKAKTLEFLDGMTSRGMVTTSSVLRTLIQIEIDLNREKNKDEYITTKFLAKLYILRRCNITFTPKLIERLLGCVDNSFAQIFSNAYVPWLVRGIQS